MIRFSKTNDSTTDSLTRRILKVLTFGKLSVNNAYQASPFGIDSNPMKGSTAVIAESTGNGEKVVLGYLNKNQIAERGGFRIYAEDEDGDESIYIYLRPNGQIEFGGNDDFMVRYSALETAFNELQQKFNTHIHPASSGTTSPTATQSTGDITEAKINDFRIP